MNEKIDEVNREFYDNSGRLFDTIPFNPILPELLLKYGTGSKILEIGCGPGALGAWLKGKGCEITCLEPSRKLAELAMEKTLDVYPITIQEFESDLKFDCIVAVSSLIHVPKNELPAQIEKIANFLNPQGIFFVSFIEGDDEGFEDPTMAGKLRFFAKWSQSELERLLSPYFNLLESHQIYNKKMERMFFLNVYALKPLATP